MRSIHSNSLEDRTWAFYCRSDKRIGGSCYYSGWKNTFDNPLTFQCSSGVITGSVESVFNVFVRKEQINTGKEI